MAHRRWRDMDVRNNQHQADATREADHLSRRLMTHAACPRLPPVVRTLEVRTTVSSQIRSIHVRYADELKTAKTNTPGALY